MSIGNRNRCRLISSWTDKYKEVSMKRTKTFIAVALTVVACGTVKGGTPSGDQSKIVQAGAVLTVSESKRVIAKAVAQMPIVKEALKNGMVIITKGTTNTYVAEEILGRKIPRGALVSGRVYPVKGGKRLKGVKAMKEIVLVKGELMDSLSLADAVKKLKPGDVVIKGANALDYENKIAGVLIGAPNSGTTGTFMPYVVARKANLIIPVGLEKQAAGKVVDIANRLREPMTSLNRIPSMFLLTGHIVTEIEALKILADVSAFQAAAGGISGAEGSVRIVFRGNRENVEKMLRLIEGIQGEPPFVE